MVSQTDPSLAPCAKDKNSSNATWILDHLAPTPDFPVPGVLFQWYGPLMRHPKAFGRVINEFCQRYRFQSIDAVIGIESRGFIFAAALALALQVPFVPVRKPGKLPGEVITMTYQKEYGSDALQIERVALRPGDNTIIIDDVVATGGTSLAAAKLTEQLGANVVEIACMIELPALSARERLPYALFSLLAI